MPLKGAIAQAIVVRSSHLLIPACRWSRAGRRVPRLRDGTPGCRILKKEKWYGVSVRPDALKQVVTGAHVGAAAHIRNDKVEVPVPQVRQGGVRACHLLDVEAQFSEGPDGEEIVVWFVVDPKHGFADQGIGHAWLEGLGDRVADLADIKPWL